MCKSITDPAIPVSDAIIVELNVDDCTVTMQVKAMPERLRDKDELCRLSSQRRLYSSIKPALYDDYDCDVYLWGIDELRDNDVVSLYFSTPAEAVAYKERVEALIAHANELIEKGEL